MWPNGPAELADSPRLSSQRRGLWQNYGEELSFQERTGKVEAYTWSSKNIFKSFNMWGFQSASIRGIGLGLGLKKALEQALVWAIQKLRRLGGVLIIFLGGGVPPCPENPYPISDQKIRFSIPYFRPDSQMYTLFQTLWCVTISATLNRFTAYGTSWRPKRCSCFFEFAINVHGNIRYSKNGIPDQTDGIYTLFQTKWQNLYPISD